MPSPNVHNDSAIRIYMVGGNSSFESSFSDLTTVIECPDLGCPPLPSKSLSFGENSTHVDIAEVSNDKIVKCRMQPKTQISQLYEQDPNLTKLMAVSFSIDNRLILMEQIQESMFTMVAAILNKQKVQEWYTIEEFAELVGKAKFTVREWCRNGQIHAKKAQSGRGPNKYWVISHDEWIRYQRDNLLPDKKSG